MKTQQKQLLSLSKQLQQPSNQGSVLGKVACSLEQLVEAKSEVRVIIRADVRASKMCHRTVDEVDEQQEGGWLHRYM